MKTVKFVKSLKTVKCVKVELCPCCQGGFWKNSPCNKCLDRLLYESYRDKYELED